jgi:Fe-S-cluster containining protein
MEHANLTALLNQYGILLVSIDTWFSSVMARYPDLIRCGRGCSGCCRGLFDITLADALLLQRGLADLTELPRSAVLVRAPARLVELQRQWPDLEPPYILNLRPEQEWELLMPDDDETPCPLLDDDGTCLLYDCRPMTCRLHGLPLIDISGEVMHDEWCTDNFPSDNPLRLDGIAAPFTELFRNEVRLGCQISRELLGEPIAELDTLIPLALLTDFGQFDWQTWWREHFAAYRTAREAE